MDRTVFPTDLIIYTRFTALQTRLGQDKFRISGILMSLAPHEMEVLFIYTFKKNVISFYQIEAKTSFIIGKRYNVPLHTKENS